MLGKAQGEQGALSTPEVAALREAAIYYRDWGNSSNGRKIVLWPRLIGCSWQMANAARDPQAAGARLLC